MKVEVKRMAYSGTEFPPQACEKKQVKLQKADFFI